MTTIASSSSTTNEGGAVSAVGEEAIRQMLISLKDAMREGEDCLDPLALEVQTIIHRHPAISLSVTLSSMVLKGLSEFRIEEVNFNFQALSLAVSLSYEALTLEGRYEFKGKLVKILPISGKGPFYVNTYHPMVRLRARLREVRGHLEIQCLKSELDIHGVKTRLNRLPGGALVSRALDNVLSEQLHRERPRLAKELSASLKELLNSELKTYNFGVSLQLLRTGDKLVRRGSFYNASSV